jgi:hypothetical protein
MTGFDPHPSYTSMKLDLVLVAAIGIDGKGVKHPLGLIEGAPRHRPLRNVQQRAEHPPWLPQTRLAVKPRLAGYAPTASFDTRAQTKNPFEGQPLVRVL